MKAKQMPESSRILLVPYPSRWKYLEEIKVLEKKVSNPGYDFRSTLHSQLKTKDAALDLISLPYLGLKDYSLCCKFSFSSALSLELHQEAYLDNI